MATAPSSPRVPTRVMSPGLGGTIGGVALSVSIASPSPQAQAAQAAKERKHHSGGGTPSGAASPATQHGSLGAATPVSSLLPDDWQSDSSVTQCHHCRIRFSLLTRKHHCRSCGLIHCDNCSKYRSAIPSKNYLEKVRVCGKCYYGLKKGKKGAGENGADGEMASSPRTHHRGGSSTPPIAPSSGNNEQSLAKAFSSSRSTSSSSATHAELQAQLSALQSLHTSYQPEHQYLTTLLANGEQLEQTYVATIQFLYSYLQQQHVAHQATVTAQQKQIEQLEELLRTAGSNSGPHSLNRGSSPGPRAASPSFSLASNPSSRAPPSVHGFSTTQQQQQHQPKQLHSSTTTPSVATPLASAGSPPSVVDSSLQMSPFPFPPLPAVFSLPTPSPPSASTVLSVTEPPSPPDTVHAAAANGTAASSQRSKQRASSGPAAAKAPREEDPSVHLLLDAIGM